MTLHIPIWYLAMVLPTFAHYMYMFVQVARQSTLTNVTDRQRASFMLGVLVGAIQSGLLWPLYVGGIAVSALTTWLDRKEGL